MNDLLIDASLKTKASVTDNFDSKYLKLKQEYDIFVKKTGRSDFANSPVLIRKQLDLLSRLKESAKAENLSEELTWIEKEQVRLNSVLDTYDKETSAPASFYQYGFIPSDIEKNSVDIESVLEACKDANGKYDSNTVRMVMAFKDAVKKDEYFIPYIVKKCRMYNGNISLKDVELIEALSQAKVSPTFIYHYLDSLLLQKQNEEGTLNADICNKLIHVKTFGFDDVSSLSLAKLLMEGFLDEDEVIRYVQNLSDADISFNSVIDILTSLTVQNPSSNKKYINERAVNSIINLKNLFVKTRNNERKERLTPIGQYNTPKELTSLRNINGYSYFQKNNGEFLILPLESSIEKAKKIYQDSVAQKEEELLKQIAKNYLNEFDGSINTNFLRVISVLRGNGITYDALLQLTDMCLRVPKGATESVNNARPDLKTINLVKLLHTSGLPSEDIPSVINSISRDSEENYNENEIQDALYLIERVIGEPELSQLLSDTKQSDKVKNFIFYAADTKADDDSLYFKNRKNISDLVNMTKLDGENVDEDALAVMSELLEQFRGPVEDFMTLIRQLFPDMITSDIVTNFVLNGINLNYDDGGAYFENIKDLTDIVNLTRLDNRNIDEDLLNLIGEFLFYNFTADKESFMELIKFPGFIQLVSKFLPDMQKSEDVMNFVFNASNLRKKDDSFYFENIQDIEDLVNMSKPDGKNVDENILKIIEKALFEEFDGPSKQFMHKIPRIIKKALKSK